MDPPFSLKESLRESLASPPNDSVHFSHLPCHATWMNCHGLKMSCLFHHHGRLHRLSVRLREPLRKRIHGQYLSHELLFHLYSQFPVVSPDPWKRTPACWYCRYRFLMKACLSPCTKILRIPLNICFYYPRRSSFMSSEA